MAHYGKTNYNQGHCKSLNKGQGLAQISLTKLQSVVNRK